MSNSSPAVAMPAATPGQPAAEYYPMPSFPMLAVADLAASSRRYQEALGFQDVFTMRGADGAPVLVHLRWRKYADLLMRAAPPTAEKKGVGIVLNIFAFIGKAQAAAKERQ